MSKDITIKFKVTPSQKETIDLRVVENGFDDISSYIKVLSLKTQPFNYVHVKMPQQEASIELSFNVSEEQNSKIEENMKASECDDLEVYLNHVTQYGVVSAVVEVRSTGNLESIIARIEASRKK